MKYVIWGMGQNGQELYSIMHHEDVCAIIDKNKDNHFLKMLNLPIITFDEYLEKREELPEHLVVVSTFKYPEMEKLLIDNGITNYSLLKKSRVGMIAYASLFDGSYCDRLGLLKSEKYHLAHIGFYQDLLYSTMVSDGFEVDWTNDERRQTEVFFEDRINKIYYGRFDEQISELKDKFKDRDVFIIGCGPSLTASDLDKLYDHGCISISVNDIFYMFSKTKWRPDYYLASDRRQLSKNIEDLEAIEAVKPLKKIYSDNYTPLMLRDNDSPNTLFFRQIQDFEKMGFSLDCSEGVYCSNTIVYAALQFAVYMGAKTIYLLGCDNGIAPGKRLFFYEDKQLNDNINDWEKIVLEAYSDMEIGYRIARRETEKIGVKIYNATRGGYLEVFERIDFDSIFEQYET